MKNTEDNPGMRVLKTATCISITGKSTLTYQVGANPNSTAHIRITKNTGAGFFSDEWVPYDDIQEAMKDNTEGAAITSIRPCGFNRSTQQEPVIHRQGNLLIWLNFTRYPRFSRWRGEILKFWRAKFAGLDASFSVFPQPMRAVPNRAYLRMSCKKPYLATEAHGNILSVRHFSSVYFCVLPLQRFLSKYHSGQCHCCPT
jgi:hypothetical protein